MARTRETSWTRRVNSSRDDADEHHTARDEELEEEEEEEEEEDDDQRCGKEGDGQADAEQEDDDDDDDGEEAEDDDIKEEQEQEHEEEEEEDEPPMRDMPCKRGDVAWRSRPSREPPRRSLLGARSPLAEAPAAAGPTPEAARVCVDELSSFLAFLEPGIQETVVRMTNLEAARREEAAAAAAAAAAGEGEGAREQQPGRWGSMDATDFRAYVGLLILSGVYRSRGEAAESLWDSESGRAIFRATMSLKRFRAYSSLLRFDDRRTRGADDRLAPIRRVWEAWSARLPLLYAPGPEVTVDERLVPFRGRCSFRQYMPNKPARYRIKLWVTCDAKSSYAMKMNVYAGSEKARGARASSSSEASSSSSSSEAPAANLSTRVVLDCTEGLPPGGRVTCVNFFTSHELASRLHRQRGLSLLGTLRVISKAFLR